MDALEYTWRSEDKLQSSSSTMWDACMKLTLSGLAAITFTLTFWAISLALTLYLTYHFWVLLFVSFCSKFSGGIILFTLHTSPTSYCTLFLRLFCLASRTVFPLPYRERKPEGLPVNVPKAALKKKKNWAHSYHVADGDIAYICCSFSPHFHFLTSLSSIKTTWLRNISGSLNQDNPLDLFFFVVLETELTASLCIILRFVGSLNDEGKL